MQIFVRVFVSKGSLHFKIMHFNFNKKQIDYDRILKIIFSHHLCHAFWGYSTNEFQRFPFLLDKAIQNTKISSLSTQFCNFKII